MMQHRATSPATTEKPRPISKKIRTAIDALVTGKVRFHKDAAELAGISPEHLSRELSRPHIAEYYRQRVYRNLVNASARAGATKVELLDCDNAMVRERASSYVLGLVGIRPEEARSVNINVEVKAGYVIDLRDDHEIRATIDVTPQRAAASSKASR